MFLERSMTDFESAEASYNRQYDPYENDCKCKSEDDVCIFCTEVDEED